MKKTAKKCRVLRVKRKVCIAGKCKTIYPKRKICRNPDLEIKSLDKLDPKKYYILISRWGDYIPSKGKTNISKIDFKFYIGPFRNETELYNYADNEKIMLRQSDFYDYDDRDYNKKYNEKLRKIRILEEEYD